MIINRFIVFLVFSLFFSTNAFSETGNDFLYRFYSQVKTIPYKDSYAKFSSHMKHNLPFPDFIYWWDKTVDSVYVEEITQIKEDMYRVKLFFIMKAYKKRQCSEDIIDVIRSDTHWLINNVYPGKC